MYLSLFPTEHQLLALNPGGLALRGIFLSRDPEELCKERKTVLEVQGKVDLLSSSKPLQDLTVQFESVGREKRFQQCLKLKEREKYPDCLVTGILKLPFNGPQENPKYSLTHKDLESLLCHLEKIESILETVCQLNSLNDTQHQAYLIYEAVKSLREAGWGEKDCCTGVKILCRTLGNEISPKIKEGEQWKAWSKIDKEQSRLRHRGAEPSGSYIDSLEVKKKKLREEQLGFKVSNFMIKFIEQMHSPDNFRKFFMQWLKLELDSRSRKNLKALHSKYKELCDSGKTQAEEEKLKNLDREIPESSLGLEHLLREVGQIYEATASNSTPQERSQYQQLPRYAAELMLDGVPLELIDGDASNIPLQWVTNVLQEISDIIGKESRMFVVTVLGVQSTGKSTLLNTMFGLQFAVSSGRCTRGAFMQLLRVKDDLQKKLGCDFVMVIDTEGLKAPELSQRVDSYEHDNELATLVIGLSDLTLVNMSSENSTEMKDILQIVVHAFIRMREVGKRPNCQFIHQNAGDVAVHEKNFRDRKYFLDQLNEMTKAAARMEGREGSYSSFGDVMEYDSSKSNWYIGNLWHGNPPMAAVSPGYCKNTLDLKKHIFDCLEKRKHRPGTIHNFGEWLKNIWAAVKKENFIFSFKNSLVAEAYNDLSLQYCDWEWELREHDRFYSESDPVEKLGRQKTMYLEIFKDTYCKRDQTQKKAEMFCEDSLKPAVRDCVRSKLGAALLEDLRCNRMSLALSTSKFFHVSLLVHLLEEDCFSKYYRYINHYEDFAIEWVKECVVKHCADETDNRRTRMAGLAVDILKRVSYTAKEAIKDAGACTVSNKLEDFLDAFVAKMDSELVIPTDNLEIIAFQSDGNIKDFVDAILVGVNEIEKAMEDEIARWDVEQTISELPTKPTDELVKSLLNCRKQCPFCHVPCERAGLNHSDHFSEYHIPDGLSGYINILQVLSTEICTISVTSAEKFKNEDTDYKYVSYKNYKSVNDYYKSWQIQADSSYKASSYWKYVFHRFNRDFAQRYGVKPAEIPEGWNITKEQ
ncbi:hypothetical protein JZ751_021138, partial [Albula glossodonta]